MAAPAKISIQIPKSLRITASEKTKLKKAFKGDVVAVLKKHRVRSDITNVDNPVSDVSIIVGISPDMSGSIRKAGKKAGKKK